MALGGGTFTVQNKILPGSYINFVSVAKASPALSDRGIAAIPLPLDWGPECKMFTVEQGDFLKHSMRILGYPYTAEEMKPLREIFGHAKTVHLFNLHKGGEKAQAVGGGLKVTAKYPGTRGNDIRYSVQKNDNGTFNVSVYMGTSEVSTYKNLTCADELFTVEDPYVTFETAIKNAEAENVVKIAQPAESDDLLGLKVSALQKDITMETDGNTAYVSGTLNYAENYDGFSKAAAEKKGNYFAIKIDPTETYTKWYLQKVGGSKKEMNSKDAEHGDFAICRVDPGEVFEIGLNGGEKVLRFDFSRCYFAQPNDEDGNPVAPIRQGEQLSAAAGIPLAGGTSGEAGDENYQTFLDQAESFTCNAIGCPSTEETVKKLFADYAKRMRDEVGKKFQVVVFDYLADYEGVVSVKNGLAYDQQNAALIPWVTGVVAGTAVNKSATNMTYDGEYDVDTDYTQTELEQGIAEGSFMFHRVDDAVNVLTDINTFVSVTDEKSGDFSANQTIRVLDQIANDIAVIFGKKYIGKVPNDAAGRISFWNDVVKHHMSLQDIRAIENFSGEDVTVEQGDTKKDVVVTDYITPVNAMERLYMTVYIS